MNPSQLDCTNPNRCCDYPISIKDSNNQDQNINRVIEFILLERTMPDSDEESNKKNGARSDPSPHAPKIRT